MSIILAIIIWFVVNKSLTTTKTIPNVPVRIENIPPGKTIADMQSNGILNRRVNLTVTGSKTLLEDLTSNDIEVVLLEAALKLTLCCLVKEDEDCPLRPPPAPPAFNNLCGCGGSGK